MGFHKALDLAQSFSPSTCFRKGYSAAGIIVHCYANDTQLYLSMKPEETEQLGATKVLIGSG